MVAAGIHHHHQQVVVVVEAAVGWSTLVIPSTTWGQPGRRRGHPCVEQVRRSPYRTVLREPTLRHNLCIDRCSLDSPLVASKHRHPIDLIIPHSPLLKPGERRTRAIAVGQRAREGSGGGRSVHR